jgi:hypothetical protein
MDLGEARLSHTLSRDPNTHGDSKCKMLNTSRGMLHTIKEAIYTRMHLHSYMPETYSLSSRTMMGHP